MSGSIEQGGAPQGGETGYAHPRGSKQGSEIGPTASMAQQRDGGAGIGAEMWV